jgi:tetratricopeptide (TPR) repeat protein
MAPLDEGRGTLDRAIGLGEELGRTDSIPRALLDRAHLALLGARWQEVVVALENRDGHESDELRIESLLLAGELARERGMLDDAREAHKSALAAARESEREDLECWATIGLGYDLLHTTRFREAAAAMCQAIEGAGKIGVRLFSIEAGWGLGSVYARFGRFQEAVDLLRTSLEQAESVGFTNLIPRLLADLSSVLAESGLDAEGALELATRGDELAVAVGSPLARSDARSAVISALLALGRQPEAAALVDPLLDEIESVGSPLRQARAYLLAAKVAERQRNSLRAREMASRCVEIAEVLGCEWLLVPGYSILSVVEPENAVNDAGLARSTLRMAQVMRDG